MAPAERAAAWVRFAEEDLQMAGLALEEGIWNQVCFHSQQAVEKLLKAFLEAVGERVPKLHSLAELGLRCQARDAAFAAIHDDCLLLDRFYIPTRYPSAVVGSLADGMPDENDANEALLTARTVRRFVGARLG